MQPALQLGVVRFLGLFLALLVLPGTLLGAEEKEGLTLHQVNLHVAEAMERFRNLSTAGDVTAGQREGIEQAYKAFKTQYDAAVENAGGKKQAKTTPAPGDVKGAAEKVVALVSALHEV